MAKKNSRPSLSQGACSPLRRQIAARPSCCEPLESRRHLTATLVGSFGTNGQLIGAAHRAGTTTTLIPYGNGGLFRFTGGNTISRLLSNGKPDTRFAGGSITLAGRNPIEAVAAAPDGSVYVEYSLTHLSSTGVAGVGFQHFLKTGRLDRGFGSHRLLNLANYDRTATFTPGPISVSADNRLYYQGASNVFSLPDNGDIAGIRKTGTIAAGSRIVIRSDGALFILGSGVTAINRNFQTIRTFGINGNALGGDTVQEGAFDSTGRLLLTVAGASATAAPQLVRLTSRGGMDRSFATSGSIALPTSFLSAGFDYTGTHLIVPSDDSVVVSGGVSTTTTTGSTMTTTTQAAILSYDRRGRLINRAFSDSSAGGLTVSGGTLGGTEVDIAPGLNGNVYLSTVINRTSGTTKTSNDFLEEFTFQTGSGV